MTKQLRKSSRPPRIAIANFIKKPLNRLASAAAYTDYQRGSFQQRRPISMGRLHVNTLAAISDSGRGGARAQETARYSTRGAAYK